MWTKKQVRRAYLLVSICFYLSLLISLISAVLLCSGIYISKVLGLMIIFGPLISFILIVVSMDLQKIDEQRKTYWRKVTQRN